MTAKEIILKKLELSKNEEQNFELLKESYYLTVPLFETRLRDKYKCKIEMSNNKLIYKLFLNRKIILTGSKNKIENKLIKIFEELDK